MTELKHDELKVLDCLPATVAQLQIRLRFDVEWRRIDTILQKLRRAKLIHYRKHGRHFLWHRGEAQ